MKNRKVSYKNTNLSTGCFDNKIQVWYTYIGNAVLQSDEGEIA